MSDENRICFAPMTDVGGVRVFVRVWDRIKSPAADQIVPYDKLPTEVDLNAMSKLAVLKVNGGLGTSMGTPPFVFTCPSHRPGGKKYTSF